MSQKEARVGLVIREEPEGHLTLFLEGEMTAGRPMLKAIGLGREAETIGESIIEAMEAGLYDINERFRELLGEGQ